MTTTIRIDVSDELAAQINHLLETARAYDPSASLKSFMGHVIKVGLHEIGERATAAMRTALGGSPPPTARPANETLLGAITVGEFAVVIGAGDLEEARKQAAYHRAHHERAAEVAKEMFNAICHMHEEVKRGSMPQRASNGAELEGIFANIRAAFAAAPPGVSAIVAVALVAHLAAAEPAPTASTPPPSGEKPN